MASVFVTYENRSLNPRILFPGIKCEIQIAQRFVHPKIIKKKHVRNYTPAKISCHKVVILLPKTLWKAMQNLLSHTEFQSGCKVQYYMSPTPQVI